MRITGQCHCGYVTYEAVIDPLAVGICHLRDRCSIDQRVELEPCRQVWCRSAVPWLSDIAALPGAEREG